MSSLGRAPKDNVSRIAEALERLAIANEDIVKLAKAEGEPPVIEVEPGPAYCPHCGKEDPLIVTHSGDGAGRMSEFFLHATCRNCETTFYGLVQGWTLVTTVDDLREQLKGGRDNGNHS